VTRELAEQQVAPGLHSDGDGEVVEDDHLLSVYLASHGSSV
jgi:hypothetical protein